MPDEARSAPAGPPTQGQAAPASQPEDARRDGRRAPAADVISPWVRLRSAHYHPFIFRRMIRAADRAARPGDIVHVYDSDGRHFGCGFYNPRSQIVLRMLRYGPQGVDDAFWRERFASAVALRRRLGLEAQTDAYRLVHSEGDGISGLIAERYADTLVFEVFSLGVALRMRELAAHLARELGPPTSLDRPQRAGPHWRIETRIDERVRRLEGVRDDVGGQPLRVSSAGAIQGPGADAGTAADPGGRDLIIREHDVRYRVDVLGGHKTGFFCDQRDNRRKLAAFCRDADVLDLCAYTGGFGLCAKKLGGAREVTCVDLDEKAIEIAGQNANLNQVRVQTVHSDVFIYLRQMLGNGRQFDVVVLDPSKLAASRDELETARAKYHDLNKLAIAAVRPGGLLLTCSCSGLVSREMFLEIVHQAGRRAQRTLQLLETTGAAPDHPVMFDCPESSYLKAAWIRVL